MIDGHIHIERGVRIRMVRKVIGIRFDMRTGF